MRQRAAASLLYQSQHAEPAFRNLQKLIFLKIVGRILAFYMETADDMYKAVPHIEGKLSHQGVDKKTGS